MNRTEQISLQIQEIEARACDVQILLKTIFEKIDSSNGEVASLEAINTLASCALRCVSLILEHNQHISALAHEMGGQQ